MKLRIVSLSITLALATNCFSIQRSESAADSLLWSNTDLKLSPKKNFWGASGMVLGTNAGFWAFSKYALKAKFANISFATMKRNLSSEFVWDNDELSTNLIGHPYQGGLYFAAARANNYSFLESLPFAFIGSLSWEYLFENEPPSINDLISTPFAGAAFGEIMHRSSSLVLNESARGFNRAKREVAAFLIDPPRGILRLITGDAWRNNSIYTNKGFSTPYCLTAGLGLRHLAKPGERSNKVSMLTLNLNYRYNDPFEREENIPFEYFRLNSSLNLGGNQPVLGELSFSGALFGRNFEWKNQKMLLGVFQNYRYIDMNQFAENKGTDPFRMSETVSYGIGSVYHLDLPFKETCLNAEAQLSGIALGGVLTDYYNFGKRNYNYGFGYSFYALAELKLKRFTWFTSVYGMYLLSPEGYENKDFSNIDQLHLDAMGDTGSSYVSVFKTELSLDITDSLEIDINSAWYFRRAKYKYRPEFNDNLMGYGLSLNYSF